MAMILTEGFDSYASSASLSNRYSVNQSPWTWQATAGRVGGGAIQAVGDASSGSLLRTLTQEGVGISTGIALGFWFKMSAAPATELKFLQLLDTSLAERFALAFTTGGLIRPYVGGVAGTIGVTNVCNDSWHYLEYGSNGNDIYIDAFLEVGDVGLINTSRYVQWSSMANRTITIDDFILYNGANTYPDVDVDFPLGPQLIHTIRPASDAIAEFARQSGAANALMVNEVSLNTDNWVQGADVGELDLYTYDATFPDSPTPDRIHTAMATSYVRNPEIGQVEFNQICRHGSDQQNGTATSTPLSGQYFQQSFPLNPQGSAIWTPTTINAAEFGIRVAAT